MDNLDDTMEEVWEDGRKAQEPFHDLIEKEGIEQTNRVFDGKPESNKIIQ